MLVVRDLLTTLVRSPLQAASDLSHDALDPPPSTASSSLAALCPPPGPPLSDFHPARPRAPWLRLDDITPSPPFLPDGVPAQAVLRAGRRASSPCSSNFAMSSRSADLPLASCASPRCSASAVLTRAVIDAPAGEAQSSLALVMFRCGRGHMKMMVLSEETPTPVRRCVTLGKSSPRNLGCR